MNKYKNSGYNECVCDDCPCPPSESNHNYVKGQLIKAYLELTPFCNNRCPGCLNESFIENFANRSLQSSFDMPILETIQWLEILAQLPDSLESVVLSGGEPTFYPTLFNLLQEMERQGLRYSIFTNGRWSNTENLLDKLQQLNYFGGFLISLHGTTPYDHDVFCGVSGSFDEILCNIRKTVELGFPITLSTVITRQNIGKLERMPTLALDLGVRKVVFNRYIYTPKRFCQSNSQFYTPSLPDLRSEIGIIEALKSKYDGQLKIEYGPTIPQCFQTSSSSGCMAGESALTIDPWGNVKPCIHTDLLCGNLLKQDFETIWQGKNLSMWRDLSSESCLDCSSFPRCRGGCRAMTLAWGQNRDPLMTKSMEKFRHFERLIPDLTR